MVTLSGVLGFRRVEGGRTCDLPAHPPAASSSAIATAITTAAHADVFVFLVFTGVLLFMGSGRRRGQWYANPPLFPDPERGGCAGVPLSGPPRRPDPLNRWPVNCEGKHQPPMGHRFTPM